MANDWLNPTEDMISARRAGHSDMANEIYNLRSEIEELEAKCERYEAALIVMGGLVRAAIDGNAATRKDVILQIGRMISQALNEKEDK